MLLSFLFFLSTLFALPAQSPAPPLGVWADDTGDSHIELYRCGEQLCGRLVWLREPTDANGKPRLDQHQEDEGEKTLGQGIRLQSLGFNRPPSASDVPSRDAC